jgi:hypothetical protein
MLNDHLERRSYRKSPGRQYGYDYDPLRSRSEGSQSGKEGQAGLNERGATRGTTGSRSSSVLSQRPDPRRTRQLLRKNIIASKSRVLDSDEAIESGGYQEDGERFHHEEEQISRRYPSHSSRSGHLVHPPLPSTRELEEATDSDEEWHELEPGIDPDLDYEDPMDVRMREYIGERPVKSGTLPPQRYTEEPYLEQGIPSRVPGRSRRPLPPAQPDEGEYEDDYDDDDDYYEEPPPRRRGKKRGLSRRGVLLGLGAAAVAGTGYAAYQYAPKIPQVVGDVGANIEKQLEEAFNKGLQQGADNARKELMLALESLEGFTLEGAITAARLTRVAYDVFVSPVIQFGANIATDFLSAMLKAFKSARMLLAGVYQDNATLQAIQKVLESWVGQVNNMPKQLNAITQADLDGAQAYLRALQRKIEDEKKKISGGTGTPDKPGDKKASPTPKPTPKPK